MRVKKLDNHKIENQAIDFLNEFELILIKAEQFLNEKLIEICNQYCESHHLPSKAIAVQTRRKSPTSFINKLKRKGVTDFDAHHLSITDIIGARIICWFVDDCFGILEALEKTELLSFVSDSVENFIKNPKDTGYRSIHILNELNIDEIGIEGERNIPYQKIMCEVQVRTKLQDSWAEITHEFHYKAKYAGVENTTYESLLGDISDRLAIEDKTLIKFRDMYGKLAERKNKMILLTNSNNSASNNEVKSDDYGKVDLAEQKYIYDIYPHIAERSEGYQYSFIASQVN